MPGAFLGFYAAVLFGAVLSSFNSLLNSSATLFGHDLYKQFFNKNASGKQTVKAGKFFGLIVAALAMFIAPLIANAPDGLFSYIQQALGSLSVPILAVVVMGMVSKKVPAIGAKVVLIGGVMMYLISLLILSPHFVNGALEAAEANGITDAVQLSIIKAKAYPHFLHIMGILFVINIGIMLIFASLKPVKEEDYYVPVVTEEIDVTPWKHSKIVGIVITLLVLSTYLIFS